MAKATKYAKGFTLKTNTLGTKTAKIMLNHIKVKVGSLLLLAIALCGCTHTWNYENDDIAYRYYVIDAHADIPDADFATFEEASVYQKEYAEHHDYVIVKIDKRFKVYNMELTDTIQDIDEN